MKVIYSALILLALIFILWVIGGRINNDVQPVEVKSHTDKIEYVEPKENYDAIGDNSLQEKPETDLKSDTIYEVDELDPEDSFQTLSEISFFRQVGFKEIFYQDKFIGLSVISEDNELELSDFGLVEGDLITHVEEEVISDLNDFEKKIIYSRNYETALVTINRNNTILDIDIAIE